MTLSICFPYMVALKIKIKHYRLWVLFLCKCTLHLATMWTQYVNDYLSMDKKAQHYSAQIHLKHGNNVETGFSMQSSSSR